MELSFFRPDEIVQLAPDLRAECVWENNDLCVLDEKRFFIRAVLPLPIVALNRMYNIGIWVEVDATAFSRVYELWTVPDQANEPPFKATIANQIPLLPDTLGLSAQLHLTGATTRPQVEMLSENHPLRHEQSLGINTHRAYEYTSLVR